MVRARNPLSWATSMFLLLLARPSIAVESDFSFYPADSQNCLEKSAATAGCEAPTVEQLNQCLCGNGGNFIINVAKCVGEEAKNSVGAVYDTMQGACSTSDTPMKISQSDFFDAANGDVATTTTDAPSSTQTSEPTETTTTEDQTSSAPTSTSTNEPDAGNESDNGGLSQGATIGIGVGAGAAGMALIGAAVFMILRRRRRSEESHPMLPQHGYDQPTTFPPSEPSPAFGPFTDAKNSPALSAQSNPMQKSTWSGSPPFFQGQHNSHHQHPQQQYSQAYHQQQYGGGYLPQNRLSELSQTALGDGPVEMDGAPHRSTIAEMPGSSPQPSWNGAS